MIGKLRAEASSRFSSAGAGTTKHELKRSTGNLGILFLRMFAFCSHNWLHGCLLDLRMKKRKVGWSESCLDTRIHLPLSQLSAPSLLLSSRTSYSMRRRAAAAFLVNLPTFFLSRYIIQLNIMVSLPPHLTRLSTYLSSFFSLSSYF